MSVKKEHKELKDIEYYLLRLRRITFRLNKISILIFILFLSNLLLISTKIFIIRSTDVFFYKYRTDFAYELFFFGMILSIFGILALFRYGQLSNIGKTYYEEITHESEWGGKEDAKKKSTPSIEVRVVTKSFLRSSDLPFVKGSNGITVYFILFVLLMIINGLMGSKVF